MSAPNPRFTLTKTLSGTLSIEGNRVSVADLEAFVAAAKRKGAAELTFTATSDDGYSRGRTVGVSFTNEAAEA